MKEIKTQPVTMSEEFEGLSQKEIDKVCNRLKLEYYLNEYIDRHCLSENDIKFEINKNVTNMQGWISNRHWSVPIPDIITDVWIIDFLDKLDNTMKTTQSYDNRIIFDCPYDYQTQQIFFNYDEIDDKMWKLLDELKFQQALNHSFMSNGEIYEYICGFLQYKIDSGELTVEEIDLIHDKIAERASLLADLANGFWVGHDDTYFDISTAAVVFGKNNYEKCIRNHDYLVSMQYVTKAYENVLYPFTAIVHGEPEDE